MITALIIPCYNESQRLKIDEFISFSKLYKNIHIWFVNDGSKDNTLEIIKTISDNNPNQIFYYSISSNVGKAEAIRQGINYVHNKKLYDNIGFMDADLSAPLNTILPLLSEMNENKYSIVVGCRINLVGATIIRSKMRHWVSRIFATYYSILLSLENYDTQCGVKLFDASIIPFIFNSQFLSKWFFDIEIFLRAKALLGQNEYLNKIKELPISNWQEIGDSRLKLTDFMIAPLEILKIKFKYNKNKYV